MTEIFADYLEAFGQAATIRACEPVPLYRAALIIFTGVVGGRGLRDAAARAADALFIIAMVPVVNDGVPYIATI